MSTYLIIAENSQKPQFSSLSKVNKCLYTETSHFRNVSQSLRIPNPIFFTTSASGGIDPRSIWPYHIFYHWLKIAFCLCFFLVYWTTCSSNFKDSLLSFLKWRTAIPNAGATVKDLVQEYREKYTSI